MHREWVRFLSNGFMASNLDESDLAGRHQVPRRGESRQARRSPSKVRSFLGKRSKRLSEVCFV
jgi:hypothetical protein